MRREARGTVASVLAACALLAAQAVVPVVVHAQSAEPRAQQPPRTAEEHHAARRDWLERQRLGDTAAAAPSYGGARGPARAPDASGPSYPAAADPGGRYAPLRGAPYGEYARGGYPPAGGMSAWCLAELRSLPPTWGPGLPLVALEALCVPTAHAGPFGAPSGRGGASSWPGDRDRGGGWGPRPEYDPAYPPVNRFYHRFQPPADRAAGGHAPAYGTGIHVLPPDPWRLPPWYYGVEPLACAEVRVGGPAGAVRLEVALPVLGALSADELELAIDAALSRGRPVQLQALDGRWLRIMPETELDHLSVRPCALPR